LLLVCHVKPCVSRCSPILPDGATRIGAAVMQEMRNAIFANVAQKAIRQVSCNVFEHLLRLDLNFHLSRQTGGLTRALDRGTKGISFLLTSMVGALLQVWNRALSRRIERQHLQWHCFGSFSAIPIMPYHLSAARFQR